MDPGTVLASALALGAAAALKETASGASRDAYKALKNLIVKKFGPMPAVDALESAPSSVKKREAAAEDLGAAAMDAEICKAAKELTQVTRRDDPEVSQVTGIVFEDVVARIAEIDGVISSGDAFRASNSQFDTIKVSNVVAGAGPTSRP